MFVFVSLLPLIQLAVGALIPQQSTFNYHFSSNGLPVDNPTRSFWLDSDPDLNPLAEVGSKGPLTPEADVCIIGSGITGISTAYHLSKLQTRERNGQVKVVVLEARKFCSGATGRNGGHLTPYGSRGFNDLVEKYGVVEANKTFSLEEYTSSQIVELIRKHGLEERTSLVHGGHNTIYHDLDIQALAKLDYESAKAAGLDVSKEQWLSEGEMLKKYGAHFPGSKGEGHNIWPMKLVTELHELAKASPLIELILHTLTPVTLIKPTSSSSKKRWELTTPRGTIDCNYVVHATNAYTSYLLPQFSGQQAIVPTRGQIIAFRANATIEALTNVSWDNWNGNWHHGYWHPYVQEKNPPLIILGGPRNENETGTFDDSVLNPDVGKDLRNLLPGLFPRIYNQAKTPEMEWTGIMGYTKLEVPFVGPVPPGEDGAAPRGQFISAGYTGHGMPRAFSCAQIIAEMVHAEIEGRDWSPPSWLPERFLTWNRFETVVPLSGSNRSQIY